MGNKNQELADKSEQVHIQPDMLFRFLSNNKYHYLRHFIIVSLVVFLMWHGQEADKYKGVWNHLDWIRSTTILLGLFYINYYFLVPRFLFRGKIIKYHLWLVVSIVVSVGIIITSEKLIFEPFKVIHGELDDQLLVATVVLSIVLLVLIIMTTPIRLFKKWTADTQRIYDLEKQSLEFEMSSLRSQIQPHFLFNMLNNIRILIQRDKQKASEVVEKLSAFLRYLLYDNNQQTIFLSAEVRFLSDYLTLESLRRDHFMFEMEFDNEVIKGIKIPPNIFIILVENAIKHSADPTESSWIKVSLSIRNKQLHFRCINSVSQIIKINKTYGGLGLENLSRRLTLLYGKNAELVTKKTSTDFSVNLSIPL